MLRKLIAELQAFSQCIQETPMVRFYSSVYADCFDQERYPSSTQETRHNGAKANATYILPRHKASAAKTE